MDRAEGISAACYGAGGPGVPNYYDPPLPRPGEPKFRPLDGIIRPVGPDDRFSTLHGLVIPTEGPGDRCPTVPLDGVIIQPEVPRDNWNHWMG